MAYIFLLTKKASQNLPKVDFYQSKVAEKEIYLIAPISSASCIC